MPSETTPLYLKKREERRLRAGHPWVFSNEVDIARSPLTALAPGQAVQVRTHADRFVGNGYVNPHSLICARLVSRTPGERLGRGLIERRLRHALALRERVFPHPAYRLAFGEGDGLPGLVVDRYGETAVAQFTTAGMERVREDVLAALETVLAPRAVVLRNDLPARALEGLEAAVETVRGEPPQWVGLEENGVRFEASPLHGQKTGWYFDHRLNRARLVRYVREARVLDAFSYTGAWGIQAACAGAREVLCVDSSEPALAQVRRHAELNGVSPAVATRRGDVFEVLKDLAQAGERFAVVVLDPPAFIRRKRDAASGGEAYRRLNRLALRVLATDGVLASASCSTHLARERLLELVAAAGRDAGRELQVLEHGAQGPDHPVHPALPESAYLKLYLLRALAP